MKWYGETTRQIAFSFHCFLWNLNIEYNDTTVTDFVNKNKEIKHISDGRASSFASTLKEDDECDKIDYDDEKTKDITEASWDIFRSDTTNILLRRVPDEIVVRA